MTVRPRIRLGVTELVLICAILTIGAAALPGLLS